MPAKIDKMKVPKHADRRVKLNDDQRREVKAMHRAGHSQRAIARHFDVSRRLISYILYPDKLAHAKKLYKERRKDGRYYKREKHTEAMRRHRQHKRLLLLPKDNSKSPTTGKQAK